MKKRSDDVYLKHILDAIARIEGYIQGFDREAFLQNALVQDGVIRQLEIVGEAARKVSPEYREKHPEVPWRRWSELRNRLIHEYFGVDLEAVWKSAREELPVLREQVRGILSAKSTRGPTRYSAS